MKKPVKKTRILCAAVLALTLLFGACGNGPAAESTSTAERQSTAAPAETTAPENTGAPAAESTSASGETAGQPAASEQTAEENTTAAPGPVSMEIRLATLNIKHGAEGLDTVAAAIREVSPDIIGLQEVDVFCERSGYVDEVEELARLAGYPYHAFARAIPLGSGEYGTALLSRFPIESFEVTPLESGNGENRAIGHAVINAEGIKLDVFVTHLSFEDRNVRIGQMKTIAKILKKCSRYVVLADLNSFVIDDISYLEAAYYVNSPARRYQTFRYRESSPDNIVVSEGFTELSSGVSDAECSDHKFLYAVFRLVGE
ncbi:MAG: endonuclease/exonuclease/phosphatase family protein [Lachnospiraceae bacterium]|nr:endonuclease/exonuclease/phosphatase family protein [Lachnospiraceae bacterium]